MPPRKKEKTVTTDDTAAASKRTKVKPATKAAGSLHAPYSDVACKDWFSTYLNFGEEDIGPDGTAKICEELGINADNVLILIIAWRLKCKRMCYFTLSEWMAGMRELKCDNMAKLQGLTHQLMMSHSTHMKDIHRYAFDFLLSTNTVAAQKSIDVPMAQEMLKVVYSNGQWKDISFFNAFLEQSSYRVLNRDQWNNIYEWSVTVNDDLSNYNSDTSAWPCLFDEYVTWKTALMDRNTECLVDDFSLIRTA